MCGAVRDLARGVRSQRPANSSTCTRIHYHCRDELRLSNFRIQQHMTETKSLDIEVISRAPHSCRSRALELAKREAVTAEGTESVRASEVGQIDDEAGLDYVATYSSDQLERCRGGTSRGDQVVHE